MRHFSLAVVVGLLAFAPGCFLYVDGDGDGDHPWKDDVRDGRDDDDDDDDGDGDVDDDVDDDTDLFADLDVTITITPGDLELGATTILDVDIEGEATGADVFDVDFGDDVDVLDIVVRSDTEILVAVTVSEDAPLGELDVVIDFGDLGVVRFPGAVVVVDKFPTDGSGDGDGNGNGGAHDTGMDPADCP